MRKTEYIRIPLFATLAELRKAERRKAMLENAGYTLTHEAGGWLVYRKGGIRQ